MSRIPEAAIVRTGAPTSRRLPVWAALAAVVTLLSCSTAPTEPPEQPTYAITGHVKLTGVLTDVHGIPVGTKVVGDADGVPVELVFGTNVVAQTTTVDGVYRFAGIKPGGYFAQSSPVPPIGDETEGLTVANMDLAVADTIRLEPHATVTAITAAPNPMVASGTQIVFDVPGDSALVTLTVRAADGALLKTLFAGRTQGTRTAPWDGRDSTGNVAAESHFWVLLVTPFEQSAQLVFK